MIPWYTHILEQNSALKLAFSSGFGVEVGVKYKIARTVVFDDLWYHCDDLKVILSLYSIQKPLPFTIMLTLVPIYADTASEDNLFALMLYISFAFL